MSAYLRDIGRLVQSGKEEERDAVHVTTILTAESYYKFSVLRFSFPLNCIFLRKCWFKVFSPSYRTILSPESSKSLQQQASLKALKGYWQILENYLDQIAHCESAMTLRLLYDDTAKQNGRIEPLNRYPTEQKQPMELFCIYLKTHIKNDLSQRKTRCD